MQIEEHVSGLRKNQVLLLLDYLQPRFSARWLARAKKAVVIDRTIGGLLNGNS